MDSDVYNGYVTGCLWMLIASVLAAVVTAFVIGFVLATSIYR
jgi:ABC-type polysaccharide/polyol phosphate export permease